MRSGTHCLSVALVMETGFASVLKKVGSKQYAVSSQQKAVGSAQ
jgi:hypothetical protein